MPNAVQYSSVACCLRRRTFTGFVSRQDLGYLNGWLSHWLDLFYLCSQNPTVQLGTSDPLDGRVDLTLKDDVVNVSVVDGCPKGCGTHGTCRLFHVDWACTCLDGWKGTACEVAMETNCNSGSDEDGGSSLFIRLHVF